MPVYAGFTPAETRAALRQEAEPSYQGTFMGARRYVLHTFATTQSALMKKRVARFMIGTVVPGVPRQAPQARGAVGHLRRARHRRAVAAAPRSPGRGAAPGRAGPLRRAADAQQEPCSSRAAARRDTARRVAAGGSAHAGAPDVRRTPDLSHEKRIAAQRIAHDLLERDRHAAASSGLGYLSLDRSTPTLSPGELQRLRLATQLRSNLFGVVYVLDEPTAGLHPADNEALLRALGAAASAPATRCSSSSTTSTPCGAPTGWSTSAPTPASTAARCSTAARPTAWRRGRPRTPPATCSRRRPRAETARRGPSGWLELRSVTRNNLRGLDAASRSAP